MTHRERVLRGEVTSEHLVQLFDEPDSRVEAVAALLYRGWLALCGYASAHFGDARDAEALHRICRAHTGVHADAGDLLGTWLLNDRRSRYHAVPEA